MAISAKVSNRIKLDTTGYATGVLQSIEEDESQSGGAQFKFLFKVAGTRQDVEMRVWTGTNFSSRMTKDKAAKVERLNKLTTITLALGALKKSDVETIDSLSDEGVAALCERLEGCVGTSYKFKTIKSKASKFDEIDIETIEAIAV